MTAWSSGKLSDENIDKCHDFQMLAFCESAEATKKYLFGPLLPTTSSGTLLQKDVMTTDSSASRV